MSRGTAADRPLSSGDLALLCASVVLLGLFMFAPGPADPRLPELASLEPEQKKSTFFEFLRPIVADANAAVRHDRARLEAIAHKLERGRSLSWFERRRLEALAEKYRLEVEGETPPVADIVAALERRIGVVPESLALVQAAKESGWGTSRFAVEGNNLFGQRCYEPGCGLRPQGRPNAGFGVARYTSVADSVSSYIRNLNTHPEYEPFRELRRQLRDAGEPLSGLRLAEALGEYSERGSDYVAEIKSLIRANGLEDAP